MSDIPTPEKIIMVDAKWAAASVEDRDIIFIATTDDMDEHFDVVLPEGLIEDSYFSKNRSVMIDHREDMDAFVGKARLPFKPIVEEKTSEHRGWKVRVNIAKTPLGDDILALAKEQFIGCSIGFVILDARKPTEAEKKKYGPEIRRIITKWDWRELSIVPMPANASCQSEGFVIEDETVAKTYKGLHQAVEHGLIQKQTLVLLGLEKETKELNQPKTEKTITVEPETKVIIVL